MENRWKQYQNETTNPNKIKFINSVLETSEQNNGIAIDLGCGAGNDSIYMIQNGWKVIAIDSEVSVIEQRSKELTVEQQNRLQIINKKFEEVQLPEEDLILANYSIPFCNPEEFEKLWNKIQKSLKPSGIFAGVLFGINDGWSQRKNMTFKTKEEIGKMLKNFKIQLLEEKEFNRPTAMGKEKHWHIFKIIARKI